MSKSMGIYCKAYYLRDLRAFEGWREEPSQARPATEGDPQPRSLDGDSIVYLQADLSVTDGIFLGEHVLFTAHDQAWQQFCSSVLLFEVPAEVLEAERLVAQDIAEAAAH